MKYLKKKFKKRSTVVSKFIDGETVLVSTTPQGDLEGLYTLNETGGRIWDLINGKRDVETIQKIIMKEHDVSPEVIEKDLIAIFKQLEQAKTIEENKAEK